MCGMSDSPYEDGDDVEVKIAAAGDRFCLWQPLLML